MQVCNEITQPFLYLYPIPTGHGPNQPIYERQVTTASRNRVKVLQIKFHNSIKYTIYDIQHQFQHSTTCPNDITHTSNIIKS